MKTFALSLVLLSSACAQGAPFKDEVDSLVRALREIRAADGSIGDGTVLTTARVLTAMGRCHRFYAVTDGPVVQPSLNFVFKHRTGVGAFDETSGKDAPAVTRAVVEALATMGPDHFGQELLECRAWLKDKKAEGPGPFGTALDALRAETGEGKPSVADLIKQNAGKIPRGLAKKDDGTPDIARSVANFERLVAFQVLARESAAAAKSAPAQRDPQPKEAVAKAAYSPAEQKAIDLLMKGQKDGKFLVGPPGKEFADLGMTGMGIAALQTKPQALRSKEEQAAIDQGNAWIAASQTEVGSFGTENVNYVTCAGMYALARAADDKWKPALAKAQKFILGIQNADARGYAKSDRDYGSIGYGGDERGDLSNMHFAIEALRVSGLPANDEALQKAIVFLERTQNLKSVNDFHGKVRDDETGEWYSVGSGEDGGAAYYPGNSPMGYVELPDGTKVPRSYGSMTYCLLKAYTLCGVPPGDPRVQAAVQWLDKNWTLTENPGADAKRPTARYQGLFYYYMVMAQALDLAKVEKVGGVEWKGELRKHLESLQRPDGSWLNEKNGRWWENMPTLCTVYALLALEKCR